MRHLPGTGARPGVPARLGTWRGRDPYDLSVNPSAIEDVENAVRSNRGEIIRAPRSDNPAPFTLAAWTRLLTVDELDPDLVDGFEREFGNRFSPEPGAVCPFQIDQGT